ncbi:MAG TPA: alcohol dehydrogenase catalytic domain-containing protein [Candidatus Methylacidiphilales bacterium]
MSIRTQTGLMKAAVVPAKGAPWEIRNLPVPTPGPNQVLIKVKASAMSFTDVEQGRGDLPGPFPRVVGHEVVGQIIALGDAVTTRNIGDRVGVPYLQAGCGRCEWCLRGQRVLCREHLATSEQLQGGHAEYMTAFADAAMLLPDKLSYSQAAPLFGAGYTVWSGLRRANPLPAQTVAVLGIGGLGHLALQYAKAAGFNTVAISRSPDKADFIREKLQADRVVANGEELAKAGGADVVLATGTSVVAMVDAIKGMRPDSTLVVMGYEGKPLPIPLGDLMMRRIKIIGSRANHPEHLYEALQLAASGKVAAINETYSLDEVNVAYARMIEGKVRYRAVLVFED